MCNYEEVIVISVQNASNEQHPVCVREKTTKNRTTLVGMSIVVAGAEWYKVHVPWGVDQVTSLVTWIACAA